MGIIGNWITYFENVTFQSKEKWRVPQRFPNSNCILFLISATYWTAAVVYAGLCVLQNVLWAVWSKQRNWIWEDDLFSPSHIQLLTPLYLIDCWHLAVPFDSLTLSKPSLSLQHCLYDSMCLGLAMFEAWELCGIKENPWHLQRSGILLIMMYLGQLICHILFCGGKVSRTNWNIAIVMLMVLSICLWSSCMDGRVIFKWIISK